MHRCLNGRQPGAVTSRTVTETRETERGRHEGGIEGGATGGGVTTVMAGGPNEQPNLLARQLVNTMYEVTVSSVDTVGLL